MVAPKISVVVAAYNAERYLEAALDSALDQGRAEGETEVIVVDDGSTDGTAEVLRSYGDRIRTVHQENAGPASARNHGVRMARGRWLAFLDADDVWVPGKLERQLEVAAESSAGLIYTDRMTFGDGPPHRLSADVALPEGEVFSALMRRNFITLSSTMMLREAFLSCGGFHEELDAAEDWELWLRYTSRAPVGVCREPLVLYRRHEGNITGNAERIIRGHVRVAGQALSLPPCRSWSGREFREVLALNWAACAGFAENGSRPERALACYLRSLLYSPAVPSSWRGLARAGLHFARQRTAAVAGTATRAVDKLAAWPRARWRPAPTPAPSAPVGAPRPPLS